MYKNLIENKCKRCGKPVLSVKKSRFGLDKEIEDLISICGACWTPDDEKKMDKVFKDNLPRCIAEGLVFEW